MNRERNGSALRLGRLLVALSLLCVLGACRATRIEVQRDANDVKDFFIVLDDYDALKDRFKGADEAEKLGDLIVNLDDDEVLDYAHFRLEARESKADVWQDKRPFRKSKLFAATIEENPSRVVITIHREAFKDNDQLGAGIVARVDSTDMPQAYYGTLLEPDEIAVKTTAWIFHAGPSLTVVLKNSADPVLLGN